MSDKHPPSMRGLSDAIRAQRPSKDETELTRLNKTLVKSALWKKKTLERIESSRNAAIEDVDHDVLEQVKSAMGDVIDKYWRDLVSSAAVKTEPAPEAGTAEPANDEAEQREATNARKLLALHEATMTKARYRLYEQWARVYVRSKRIDSLSAKILSMQSENGDMLAAHERELGRERAKYSDLHDAFEEFQQQADELLDELDRENGRLKRHVGANGR